MATGKKKKKIHTSYKQDYETMVLQEGQQGLTNQLGTIKYNSS